MLTQSSQKKQSQSLHSRFWTKFKHFPQGLASGAVTTPNVNGPAAAAILSAAFSCFLLMVNQHFTVVFKAWNDIVWRMGGWIPGSYNSDPLYGEIGSYSGKETMMLLGWLGSWFFLHQIWKNRQIKPRLLFSLLMTFLVAATVMNWHPIFPYLPLMPKV